jgi:integrase/recombinase XerD
MNTVTNNIQDINPAGDGLSAAEAAYLAETLARYRQGQLEPPSQAGRPIPWTEFRDQLLELYKPPLRQKATLAKTKKALRLLEELDVKSTADLTVQLIGRFVAAMPTGNSANTSRSLLRCVAFACNYAEKTGVLRASPFRARSLASWIRPTPARGRKHASREEIGKVLRHMADRAKQDGWQGWRAKRTFALASLLAHTGARLREILYLQTQDVDLEQGVIYIMNRSHNRLKTAGSEAVLALPPAIVPQLREWMTNRMSRPPGFTVDDENCVWVFPTTRRLARSPWASGGPGCKPTHVIKAVAAEVGVALTPLTLRHSMATHLLHWGAGKAMIKRILRHSNERTQESYLHDDLDNLRDTMRNVEF